MDPKQTSNRAIKNAQQQPQPPAAQTLVKVRALVPLNENGHHEKGDEFETTTERAAALGPLLVALV